MKIKDIAKIANVSVATVSRVLNNKKDVSDITRKKILKIVEENNFKPSSIARNLVKQENNTIGVIIPDIKNLYFSNIINEIVNIASQKGLNIILGCSNENFDIQDKYINLFIQERVKGILIVVTKNSNMKIEYFDNISEKIPLAFIDRKINDKFSGIYFENYYTTLKTVDKMIKNGSKKISFVSGPLDVSTALERFEAYKDALKKNNINFDKNKVFYGDFTLESGYKIAKEIIKTDIDSIFIANNLMAFGFIKAIKERGIDISKYQIATFENNEILDFMESSVLSNEMAFKELARESMELIEKKYNKEIKEKIVIINK